MKARTLNISQELAMRAATDPDFGLALAFVVLIKANSVSSVIKQYSIRDFKNRYHIGSDKIRTASKIGLKEKLLRSFTLKDKAFNFSFRESFVRKSLRNLDSTP